MCVKFLFANNLFVRGKFPLKTWKSHNIFNFEPYKYIYLCFFSIHIIFYNSTNRNSKFFHLKVFDQLTSPSNIILHVIITLLDTGESSNILNMAEFLGSRTSSLRACHHFLERTPVHHPSTAVVGELNHLQQQVCHYFEVRNTNGDREEDNVKPGDEDCNLKRDENQHQQPNDEPQDTVPSPRSFTTRHFCLLFIFRNNICSIKPRGVG